MVELQGDQFKEPIHIAAEGLRRNLHKFVPETNWGNMSSSPEDISDAKLEGLRQNTSSAPQTHYATYSYQRGEGGRGAAVFALSANEGAPKLLMQGEWDRDNPNWRYYTQGPGFGHLHD